MHQGRAGSPGCPAQVKLRPGARGETCALNPGNTGTLAWNWSNHESGYCTQPSYDVKIWIFSLFNWDVGPTIFALNFLCALLTACAGDEFAAKLERPGKESF